MTAPVKPDDEAAARRAAAIAEKRRKDHLAAVAAKKAAAGNVAHLHPTEAAAAKPAAPAPAKPAPAKPAVVAAPPKNLRRVAARATAMTRHYGLLMAFVGMVLLPVIATASYLYLWAADQYASNFAFTLRSEESTSAVGLLGGLGGALGTTNSDTQDTEVLYEFIRSQDMVAAVDAEVDLRSIYTRDGSDVLLRFGDGGTIEDLTSYWQRMVRVSYDSASGLMELRVLAFDPADATRIARAIHGESTRMINELSAVAREDATRYARDDLETTVEKLKVAREAMTEFRVRNQIVDVTADLQGQTALVSTLQAQLATALIDIDVLAGSTRQDDTRLQQAQRRIEVIEERLRLERAKFGQAEGPNGESYAAVVGEFERMAVDRQFAESAYTAALAAYDTAVAEANRRSRYLATFIQPTQAEKSQYPQRAMNVGLVALFSFLIWAIFSLVFYSLRDRR